MRMSGVVRNSDIRSGNWSKNRQNIKTTVPKAILQLQSASTQHYYNKVIVRAGEVKVPSQMYLHS